MSYLASIDGTGAGLTTMYPDNFGLDYDMHRVFATVVIGHPVHVASRTAARCARSSTRFVSPRPFVP